MQTNLVVYLIQPCCSEIALCGTERLRNEVEMFWRGFKQSLQRVWRMELPVSGKERNPAPVFLAKRRGGPEIDNPKADD